MKQSGLRPGVTTIARLRVGATKRLRLESIARPCVEAVARLHVGAGARLRMEPGARLHVGAGARLRMEPGAHPHVGAGARPQAGIPRRPRVATTALLAGCGLLLAGCDSGGLSRTFGLSRDAPDEFTVTTRAPLSMPPDFTLRPPRPGASRPQEVSARRQAEETLVPQVALGAAPTVASPGEQVLLEQAGPPVSNDIRQQINQDASLDSGDPGFVDKLLFWKTPQPTGVMVDPQKESQRLRQNAALGDNLANGETPIIQPPRKGWFQNLFNW